MITQKNYATTKWILLFALYFHHQGANHLILGGNSIPYELADYFGVKVELVNTIFVITNLLNILFCYVFIVLIDYYGPTFTFYFCQISTVLVVVLRLFSFYTLDLNLGFIVYVISQFSVSFEQISSSCVSLSLLALWFPTELRTTAQTIDAAGLLTALLTSMLFGPIFVDENASQQDFINLTWTSCSFSFVGIILGFVFLYLNTNTWSCLPKDDFASKSAEQQTEMFNTRDYGNNLVSKAGKLLSATWKITVDIFKFFGDWRGCLLSGMEYSLTLKSYVQKRYF